MLLMGAICQLKHLEKTQMNTLTERKRFHSVNLQAVTDPDLLITDAFCGYPGRVHDARVFRNSPLYQAVIANEEEFFPGNCHILGDSAYPLLSWILTPFKNYGNLTRCQRNYNFKQSSTWMVVEHLFGTLKGQFRRLKLKLDVDKVEDIPTIVIALALCTIYQFFLDDNTDEDNDYDYQDIFPPNRNGIKKRRDIMNTLNANFTPCPFLLSHEERE